MQNGIVAMENSMTVFQKLKIELAYGPAIYLLPKKLFLKVGTQTDTCATILRAAIFTTDTR